MNLFGHNGSGKSNLIKEILTEKNEIEYCYLNLSFFFNIHELMKLLENLIKKHIKKNDIIYDKLSEKDKKNSNVNLNNIDQNRNISIKNQQSSKVNINERYNQDESNFDENSNLNYIENNVNSTGISLNVQNSMNSYLNKFKLTNLNDFFNILSDLKSISQTYFIIDEVHNLDLLLRNKKVLKKFFDICLCFDIKFMLVSNFDLKNSEVCNWLNLESFHSIYFTNLKDMGCTWNFCEKWIQQRHLDFRNNTSNNCLDDESSLGLKEIDDIEIANISNDIQQLKNNNKKKSKSKDHNSTNSVKSNSINSNRIGNGVNHRANKSTINNSNIENKSRNEVKDKSKPKQNTTFNENEKSKSISNSRNVNINNTTFNELNDIEYKLKEGIIKKEENKQFFLYDPFFYLNILSVKVNLSNYPYEAKESIMNLLKSCVSQYTLFTININEIMYNFILIVHNFISSESKITSRVNHMYYELDKKHAQLVQFKELKKQGVSIVENQVSNSNNDDDNDDYTNKFDYQNTNKNSININRSSSYKSTFVNRDLINKNMKRINFLIKFQVYNSLIHTANHNEFFKDMKIIIDTDGKIENNPRLKQLNDTINGINNYTSKSKYIGENTINDFKSKVNNKEKNSENISDYGLVSSSEYSLCGKINLFKNLYQVFKNF